jgi:hypothetical protein
MSAYLDKSQGITFVYSNIFDLYKKAKDSKLDAPFAVETLRGTASEPAVGRVIKAADLAKEAPKAFQPAELKTTDTQRTFPVPMGVQEAEERARKLRSVQSLQKNLSDLSSAHEKLRFLLQELESLTKKK